MTLIQHIVTQCFPSICHSPEKKHCRLFGSSGSDSFKAAVARRDAAWAKKDNVRQERIAEIQGNESERMKKFMVDMGIKAGQKIVIKDRDDR